MVVLPAQAANGNHPRPAAKIVTFDEEANTIVTANDQHAAANNDHHAPEDSDMDTDVSEGPVVTEPLAGKPSKDVAHNNAHTPAPDDMTDQCGQTFASRDPKARTLQGHRRHRLGAMPTDPAFLRYGVYSMDADGVEC